MSNETWACFECRETVRRPGYARAAVLCPGCGKACKNLGHKLRMPSKRHSKAWQELLSSLQEARITAKEYEQQVRLKTMRELNAEIARLEAKGTNAGREKQIRLLRRQLAKL